jgi:hypothetical protein
MQVSFSIPTSKSSSWILFYIFLLYILLTLPSSIYSSKFSLSLKKLKFKSWYFLSEIGVFSVYVYYKLSEKFHDISENKCTEL